MPACARETESLGLAPLGARGAGVEEGVQGLGHYLVDQQGEGVGLVEGGRPGGVRDREGGEAGEGLMRRRSLGKGPSLLSLFFELTAVGQGGFPSGLKLLLEGRGGREGGEGDHVSAALLVGSSEALDLFGAARGCGDDKAFLEVDVAQRQGAWPLPVPPVSGGYLVVVGGDGRRGKWGEEGDGLAANVAFVVAAVVAAAAEVGGCGGAGGSAGHHGGRRGGCRAGSSSTVRAGMIMFDAAAAAACQVAQIGRAEVMPAPCPPQGRPGAGPWA